MIHEIDVCFLAALRFDFKGDNLLFQIRNGKKECYI
jgi:hypothetical protein